MHKKYSFPPRFQMVPNRFGALSRVFMVLLAFLLLNPVQAANDASYLDEIAPDEMDVQVDTAQSVKHAIGADKVDVMPNELDPVQFEESLRAKFTGSFMFYSKLDDARKKLVYEEYLVNKDINTIRKKIITLFSER